MKAKTNEKTEEIRQLDEVDRQILNILAQNSRSKLTKIAKEIQLSVDSTKKRIDKLEKDGVIKKYTIQINDSRVGYNFGVHVYVKLTNVTKEKYEDFIHYMKKNSRVINLMSMLGDYDIYIVIVAKNTTEMDRMKMEMKQRFSDIIADWKEVLVTEIYKLEEYRF